MENKPKRRYGGHALLEKHGPDYFRKLAIDQWKERKRALAAFKKANKKK
jgi:hypothetical protein